jgi:hypothetical protein
MDLSCVSTLRIFKLSLEEVNVTAVTLSKRSTKHLEKRTINFVTLEEFCTYAGLFYQTVIEKLRS